MDNKDRQQDLGKQRNEFFDNREIWEQVFGKDGRGGAIGELHDKFDSNFNDLEDMVCEEFDKLSKKLDEYNGIHEKYNDVKKELKTHIKSFKELQNEWETQESIEKELARERYKGRKEAEERVIRLAKIWGVIVGTVGLILTAVNIFLF